MTYRRPAPAAAPPPAFSSSSAPRTPAARRVPPPRRLLAAVALVALIGTGCSNAPVETGSGGGEKPGTQGGPSAEPNSNAAGGTGGGGDQDAPAGATPDPTELRELRERLPEFARCMRENGVEDFPDPGPDGIVQYDGDSDQPEFGSAAEKCDDLLPPQPGRNR